MLTEIVVDTLSVGIEHCRTSDEGIMKSASIDLFPTLVKVFDFEADPELNESILASARANADLNDSASDCNILKEKLAWVPSLQKKFDTGLKSYLREVWPQAHEPYEIDAYMFLNYTEPASSSFTPFHNHVGDADLVSIYYAQCFEYASPLPPDWYYQMDQGVFVLHDPRPDASLDKRRLETGDHYKIYPRENRMIIHPAAIAHSVAPSLGKTRLAVTCNYIVNKSRRWSNYVNYTLPL